LRERVRVRGAVNSFSPPPLSSPVNGEEVFEEILSNLFLSLSMGNN
jgi:hypothetical protein